jgi:adenylate kinase
MLILILGQQGSGKGTQAKMLADKFHLEYLDMGARIRQIAKTDSEVANLFTSGKLFPDDLIFKIFDGYLKEKNIKDDLILDGFPRRLNQYIEFIKKLKKPDLALLLEISTEESIKRLTGRRVDASTGKVYNLTTNPPPDTLDMTKLVQRRDDEPVAIRERLNAYNSETKPLIEFLEADELLIRVNGERSIDEIQNELVSIVNKQINGKN